MILFSGALLLTPGFFTDAIGFLLLVPSIRSAAYRALRARIHVAQMHPHPQGHGRTDSSGGNRARSAEVIEGDYDDITGQTGQSDGPSGWTKH
jgi:UPF0716 protein FxsA